MAFWQRCYDENVTARVEEIRTFSFVYHVELFVSFDRNNAVMRELMFIQSCADVKRQQYPCTDVDRITLLALMHKAYSGDREVPDVDLKWAFGGWVM